MKKLACILLTVMLLCSLAVAESDALAISLPGGIQGCEWTYACEDTSILSEPFVEHEEDLGDGETWTYYFGVQGEGGARVDFFYGAQDELSTPVRTATCLMSADSEGNISARIARVDGDMGILTIILTSADESAEWTFAGDSSGTLVQTAELDIDGTQTYAFRADETGTTELVFECGDMWDPTAGSSETFAIMVTVDADMNLSMYVEE